MSIPVFPSSVPIGRVIPQEPKQLATIVNFAGSNDEQRAIWGDRYYSEYPAIPLVNLTDAEKEALESWIYTTIEYAKLSFLFQNPYDKSRTAVTLVALTAGGSVTRWGLPTSGRFAGDHPSAEAGTYVVRVGGSPVTVSEVKTDDREFVLSSGVSDASDVDADFEFYSRLRLRPEGYRIRPLASGVWEGSLAVDEVNA